MTRHIYLEMAPKRTTKLYFYGCSRNLVVILVIRRDSCYSPSAVPQGGCYKIVMFVMK